MKDLLQKIDEWLDSKVEAAEKWVRDKDKDYARKVVHQSPCLHCDKVAVGSIESGFIHEESGEERCVLPDFPEGHTIHATPRSLLQGKNK